MSSPPLPNGFRLRAYVDPEHRLWLAICQGSDVPEVRQCTLCRGSIALAHWELLAAAWTLERERASEAALGLDGQGAR